MSKEMRHGMMRTLRDANEHSFGWFHKFNLPPNCFQGSSNWFMPNRSTWCRKIRKDKTTIFVSPRGLVFAAHTMALSLSIGRATLEGTGVISYRIWRPLNDTSAGHALGSPRPVPLKESARAPSGTGKPYLHHLASCTKAQCKSSASLCRLM